MAVFSGDVWVGTSLGVLKGVSVSSKEILSFLPPGLSLCDTDRCREVMCMAWKEDSKDQLYLGLRNGLVQVFDCNRNYFKGESNLGSGRGHFVGLARHNQTIITCTNEGIISFWPDNEQKSEINLMLPVEVMSASSDHPLLVATGGKDNDLKLWDGNRPDASPIFKAKNLPHDSLNMRVPVWVTSIGIVPETGDHPCVAIGTAYHQVRLYDTRAKRRPIYNHPWEESKITTLEMSKDGRYYLVGNAHGQMARVDLRKGHVLNRYHGFGGGISSLSSYIDDSRHVFAACGLDRYLRIYQVDPPSLIYKAYMKLLCKCVQMSGLHESSSIDNHEEGKTICVRKKKIRSALPQDESDDELWDNLDPIGRSNSKQKKLKVSK